MIGLSMALLLSWSPTLMGAGVVSAFVVLLTHSSLYSCQYILSLDKFAIILSLLVFWVFCALSVCSKSYTKKVASLADSLSSVLVILGILLVLSFMVENLILFYIFFEVSLIPLMVVILGWGYQVERVSATLYLLVYTLVGSFPLLLAFVGLLLKGQTLMWFFLSALLGLFLFLICYFFFFLSFSFFIKLPLYGLHLWLSKAHVEAPGMGSMVLAAVLLKLSAYGLYRVSPYFSFSLLKVNIWGAALSILGAALSAAVCMVQSDLKAMIAYSSVSHMGVMIMGFMTQSSAMMSGAWVIMLSHGFCSSALFYLANINYERHLTRQLSIVRGQVSVFYYFSLLWVVFLMINFSVPPFLTLWGEASVIFGAFWLNYFFFFFLGLNMFLVSYFCMYCFSTLIHGRVSGYKSSLGETSVNFIVLLFHFSPLIGLVLNVGVLF
uniref:NADH-ubiquinone oxidoreductase chain 4 n=1 Tax=Pseudobiotus spinifer TaxID=1477120 RepID=A0A0K0KA02_9BILA|nr:NADH dehydogenase subunit 4 [Pseudobiotus spinifer]